MFDRFHAIRGLAGKAGLAALVAAAFVVAGCGTSSTTVGAGTPTPVPCPSTTSLTGAGATFPAPLYTKEFENYVNVRCGAQVNYQAVGSGAGITQLLNKTVDFGASDSPMTDAQLAKSTNGLILHIPGTLGAVAISYNVPEVAASSHLQLTGATIADIFLGKVKSWDDPEITASNSGTTLPHQNITVVHRSDGSGTTGIFTHYLAAVSPAWASGPGAGTTINWPVGVGAKGNAAVAAQVKATKYSIGYNELAYVLTNTIQYAAVQSHDGAFIVPSLDSTKAAAASVTTIPDDLRFFIVNEPGANSYPISGFSWLLVYQTQSDPDKGQAIANLIWWMTHDGQQYATPLSYVPLPSTIVTKDEAKIKAMTCGSSSCYKG
jgi:phosphate transport system substrate-binding protein